MLRKSMVLLVLFLLVGCTVPPEGTDNAVSPNITATPTLPEATNTPVAGPTVDPADVPYLPNPAWHVGGKNMENCSTGATITAAARTWNVRAAAAYVFLPPDLKSSVFFPSRWCWYSHRHG